MVLRLEHGLCPVKASSKQICFKYKWENNVEVNKIYLLTQ